MENYSTFDIFLCKTPYTPKGICYKKICKPKDMNISREDIAERVRLFVNGLLVKDTTFISGVRLKISTYLKNEQTEDVFEMTAYILPEGETEQSMLASPPCSETDVLETNADWQTSGEDIECRLPMIYSCSVENFLTLYADVKRYDTPSHIGEADGKTPELTFDQGGYILHKTDMAAKFLIPGEMVTISYKLDGVEGYHLFASYDFQTEIFTSAEFLGCGPVSQTKKYHNPAKPEEGYSYVYTPVEGGIGYEFEDKWLFDTRVRAAVLYRGKIYWLKISDGTKHALGSRVFIAKKMADLPILPHENFDQSCCTKELDEEKDMVVQEFFYR